MGKVQSRRKRRRSSSRPGRERGRQRLIERVTDELARRQDELSRIVMRELHEVVDSEEEHHMADAGDFGGDAWDEDTALTLLEEEGNELEQIEWALERIEDGTYGLCRLCETPIALLRLETLPLATTCVECQRELESNRPQLTTTWGGPE